MGEGQEDHACERSSIGHMTKTSAAVIPKGAIFSKLF